MCFASNPESYRYIPFYSVASGRLREAVSEATNKTSRPDATEDQKATETKKPVHWGTGLKLIRREGKKSRIQCRVEATTVGGISATGIGNSSAAGVARSSSAGADVVMKTGWPNAQSRSNALALQLAVSVQLVA